MRHVITGGSGFTGAALTHQLLERSDEVVNFDLKSPSDPVLASSTRFICGDVRKHDDLAKLELGRDDVVYHLAARQFADAVPRRGRDAWFFETNVQGTQNVVDAMRAGGASHLVYFSTDMTYGTPKTCPVPPDHPQNPLGPYGRSKYAAEKILLATESIRATIFRPRLITGPGRLGILGKLFTLIKAGLPVPMIGSGTNRYQMVGVGDCARAAILAMAAGCPSGPFNLGSAEPPTTRELLQKIIEHAKSHSLLIPLPAGLLKPVLGAMDAVGFTLLFPEQFGIADIDILLDTSETRRVLGWASLRGDVDMMNAAYDAFAR
jgi:nucleoside-diphosphate-sugar epimerase